MLLVFLSLGVGTVRGQNVAQGTLDGQVYFTEVGKQGKRLHVPIRSAHIEIAGITAQTVSDAAGHFHFASLPVGQYTLTVTHPRFRDAFTASVTVHAGTPAVVPAEMGQGYYVAIGIDAYRDPEIPVLVGPVYDVKAVNRALFHQFQGHATLLVNRAATKAHIKAAIISAAAHMSSHDFFVFYFSGHGGSDRLRRKGTRINYLLPYDSSSTSYAHDISERELTTWLKVLPDPRRALLILDSCNSGAFLSSQSQHSCPAGTDIASSLSPLKVLGCTILAAAGCYENSVDEDDGSLFTDKLIEGLEHHRAMVDIEHTHIITVKELFRYAAARTTAIAKDYHEQQHPQLLAQDDTVLLRY